MACLATRPFGDLEAEAVAFDLKKFFFLAEFGVTVIYMGVIIEGLTPVAVAYYFFIPFCEEVSDII